MTERYVVASPHDRHNGMLSRLAGLYGDAFAFISSYDDLTVERLRSLAPRYVFLPHWSKIVPPEIHSQFECVIFHMTDVPFGRGGSPLQNLIARGIYETQMTALRCTSAIDAGPVYMKRPFSLHGNAEEIYLRASDLITAMIEEMVQTHTEPAAQEGEPTEFSRRTPDQSDIAALGSLRALYDQIRMLDADGYPHACAQVGRFRLEFTRAALRDGEIKADVKITESSEDD